MEGKVKWFNRIKGYGFISGDDGSEYFVHHSALSDGTFIRENDRVSFDPADSDKGKQARNVMLLQKGSEIARNQDMDKPEDAPEESGEESYEDYSEEQ